MLASILAVLLELKNSCAKEVGISKKQCNLETYCYY